MLIRMSAKTGCYIVCSSRREVERIAGMAQVMGLHIPFPMTFREFLDRRYCGSGVRGFLVDNADQLLAYLSDVPIKAITMTMEDNHANGDKADLPMAGLRKDHKT